MLSGVASGKLPMSADRLIQQGAMPRRDPYEILGIGRDATQDEAKRRFRILARQYHPDRNPGDRSAEAKFKEAEEAWTELEPILPRSAVPLEIPEGASEEEIENAYVKWLLDPKNAASRKPAARPASEEGHVWSTVAGGTGSAVVVRGDWRKVAISRSRRRHGLEGISAEQAARLLDSHPNAFAVLKIVQQHSPELCLYDAILARARHARVSRRDCPAKALVIVGAGAVDEAACEAALQDPLASVETAEENLHLIAPRVQFDGTVIPANKLVVDVWFLKENIHELAVTLPKQGRRRRGGTGMIRKS
jgi:hypothetical protein